MLDLRSPLIAICAAAGLMLGALAWLIAGQGGSVDDLQARLTAIRPMGQGGSPTLSGPSSGPPLFSLSTGPSLTADPAVTVMGVSRMPGRSAALLSVNGSAPAWLALGERRDGIVLREVGGGRVTLDLPLGLKDLRVGESTAASPTMSPPTPPGMLGSEQPPTGYRSPPPPASAPGAGQ